MVLMLPLAGKLGVLELLLASSRIESSEAASSSDGAAGDASASGAAGGISCFAAGAADAAGGTLIRGAKGVLLVPKSLMLMVWFSGW